MRRGLITFLILFMYISIFAQEDSVVLSYRRNFIRASLITKIELIQDAGKIQARDMSPLYAEALDFVLSYAPVLGEDSNLEKLALTVSGFLGVNGSSPELFEPSWKLFEVYGSSEIKTNILKAIPSLVDENNRNLAVENINNYLAQQIDRQSQGMVFDKNVVSEAVSALGILSDSSSFDVLYKGVMTFSDNELILLCFDSLANLEGLVRENISRMLSMGSYQDKLKVFRMAVSSSYVDDITRGELAEEALEAALNADKDNEDQSALELRYEAVSVITDVKWVKASPLAIKHFYLAQDDYRRGNATISMFVDSIKCLGVMGTAEAAQSLSIYLGLLNSEMEQTKNYNEQVLLAIIKSLGDLGDKSAFDYLLYVSYLDYPESIKVASRDALERLKW